MNRTYKIEFIMLLIALMFYSISVYISIDAVPVIASNIDDIIIIDAGHGGMDGGAVGVNGSIEANINLEIATKTNLILQFLGYDTYMTRTEDISLDYDPSKSISENKVVDMRKRQEVSNIPNSIFVSIHQNSYIEESSKGAQVFYSSNNENSKTLAENLQNSLVTYIDSENHRVIKEAGDSIYLMKVLTQPSIIVETGFISNIEEEKLLTSNNYQNKLAVAIVKGIDDYYSEN